MQSVSRVYSKFTQEDSLREGLVCRLDEDIMADSRAVTLLGTNTDRMHVLTVTARMNEHQIVNARKRLAGPPWINPLPIDTYNAVPMVPPMPI